MLNRSLLVAFLFYYSGTLVGTFGTILLVRPGLVPVLVGYLLSSGFAFAMAWESHDDWFRLPFGKRWY